jgi:formylglycine-generating enzyme required for sulfatase activity
LAQPPDMILIPEGNVLMGTSTVHVRYLLSTEEWAEEWYSHDMFRIEQPQHTILVPAFEIARYPVTNAEYHLFVWETGYRVPRFWTGFRYEEELANHPVVGISRVDALAYCEWLSREVGMKYRLPNEVEWERAARGDDDRIYPWGNTFDPWRCNTSESGRRATVEVGSFSPGGDSPWGVNDLIGNIWEWTSTILRAYPYDPNDGRESLSSTDVCVIRGGSWFYSRKLARCSAREGVVPTYVSPSLGIRLAKTPTQPEK